MDYAGVSPGIDISSVNFPDDNFRHIVESKAIDRDLNGFLTDDELKMATELALSKKNIKNLKGLEFFTYLMDLECANNNLTSLDITKNTELTRLDCSYNSLTSLDLSKNTKLKEVFCFSNKLTALDLSKNKNLGWLWIAGNQIEGDAMLKLVLSLPDRTEPKGELGACVEGASPDNTITVQQASLAKDKGWRVLRRGDTKWEDYDGVPTETSLIGTVFEYEDVNYKIGENNTASVTRTKDITGPILIQAYVPYKGVNYTVTSIENSAFDKGHQDKSITMVVIPPTIKVIEGEAFIDLYGLTGVYIADVAAWCNIIFKGEKSNPLEYAHHLFLTTTSEEITDLVIPEGVTNIERAAFYCCSGLKSVTIPNSVKSIDVIAFSGCSGLENVYSMIETPFAIPDNAFEGAYSATLRVPIGKKSAYQSTDGWKNFSNILEENYSGEPLGLDINATNFPDAFFRSVVSGKEIDLNQDGYLSDAELAITSLDVTGKNIKDLKGIEFFTALTQLYCSANELTSLDVSKNTALTLLYCNVNNLTSLDVSNNMSLITLNCADNYLVSLDVSKNLALTELYCQGNDIAEGGMDLLINSLPITNGVLYVSMKGNSPENVITVEHVKIANDKGWKVMGSNGEDWVEFTPDGIISVYNSGDANGVWYNLNGQRVEKPGKGLYIQNGKKVIIGR